MNKVRLLENTVHVTAFVKHKHRTHKDPDAFRLSNLQLPAHGTGESYWSSFSTEFNKTLVS